MQTKQIDLIINKLSRAKYNELSNAGKLKSDELYFVNDDNLDAYNQTISHVATPSADTDAATKSYVDTAISKIPGISAATDQTLGGIKTGFTPTAGDHNYAVTLDQNNQAYVNVPWTDVAISSARYDAATKHIVLVFNDTTKTALSVNVADLVDTYTAGTGLKVVDNVFSVSADYALNSKFESYYIKSETSSAAQVTDALSGKQDKGDYAFLSTVSSISTDLSSKSSVYITDPYYDEVSNLTSLNVVKLTRAEYTELVQTSSVLSDTIYIVSADSINAYGQQLKNLAAPTDLSDAVTLAYADEHYLTSHQSLDNYYTKAQTDALSASFRNGLAATSSLTAYYVKSETSSAVQIAASLSQKQPTGNYLSVINAGTGISVDGNTIGLSAKTTAVSVDGTYTPEFNTEHVSMEEYAQILRDGALSNSLYVVSSDFNDMMGERVTNVADPVELSDAVNKKYVDDTIDKYTLASATLSACDDGLSCQISNYTITTISITDPDTPISVILPEQTVDNKVRDFMIRFENTGSENAAVAFVPYGLEDIDYEGEDGWADIEPGVNLVSFTETKR